ncbi:protein OBERON 4 [Sesamum alatum]|uniref:Protein OBERON 4 n=1 Tax=Sesamum alatum TaxID=300844 RepID=A0AAE1XN89_9LAMI|nr:protein OBERON 4 [Sesamum alatum]
MKRLRSSDDLHSYGEKSVVKDWGRRDEDSGLQRSSSSLHRSSYYKSSDSGRKGLSSSTSRYDRLEDDRESSRLVRKRSDYDLESYDRRKSYDRHRDGNDRGIVSSSPRSGYGMDQMYRSESFSGPRRDFPKGFRSERDRPKRDGFATSWRRFGGGKDGDDGVRNVNEASRGSRMDAKEVGKAKSPQGPRDAKSPAWSKDSGSERSKSVEGKKSEDMPVESSGPSSEREEGELEPDPQSNAPLAKPVVEDKAAVELNSSQEELNNEYQVENKVEQEKVSLLSVENGDMSKMGSCSEQAEGGPSKDVENRLNKIDDLPDRQGTSFPGAGSKYEIDMKGEDEGGNDVMEDRREGCLEEDADSTCDEKLSSLQDQREDEDVKVEVKADDTTITGNMEIAAGNEPLMEKTTQTLKDKGKSIALSPSDTIHFTETNLEVENKSRDLATNGDIEMEGPSTRGFQFLSTDPIKKPEKVEQSTHNRPKDDKLALELSLSLPNVLLPIGSQNRGQTPGSPSRARSVQSFASSFRTNSEGFTASMSFSGSQQFTHNPSCSLTHNAHDYEQSVGSKPLFQGVDWKALSSDENKSKENPAYQGMSSRENGLHQQSQLFQGNSTVPHLKVAGGSSKLPIGLERQLSFSKHLAGAQGFGTYDNGPEYSKDRKHLMTEKDCGSLQKSNDPDGKEQGLVVGVDFAESIVTMIVSEPLQTMARRFNDMTGQQVACVKDFVHDIISNPGKQWQLIALQKALQKRPDVSLDMLLNAHRTQLEILVALKTGLREFVRQKYDISSSELAEIFLNMRCRNLNCKSLLPVDECDCKICAKRSDFCRDCMCLVCSKFDNASNTCGWVGCDVCLHWCHADCGLRESHIRNGRSATGAQGTTEMQFYCVACDHPSEMFGFVKEVFQNFVQEWTAENLSRELEYVRRIFSASEDVRGKQLHEIAVRALSKLANRSDLKEVQNHIISFFTETTSDRPASIPIESRKELPIKNQEGTSGIPGSSQGAGWLKSAYPDKAPRLENSVNLLPGFDSNRNDKYTTNMDLRKNSQKEPIFDELESIVRIKQAEAMMFQARADDARRESEALKRISVTKNERIEEEYTSRISKLRLAEAEEMRKQKVEELQALERAYQEYFTMKMRMETDIKDLLLKMEATRRNLAT